MMRVRKAARGLSLLLSLLAGCDDDEVRAESSLPDGGMDAQVTPSEGGDGGGGDCHVPSLEDRDKDGFRSEPLGAALVDCDDCDPLRGPDALDVPGNGIDEDCDGADAPMAATTCAAEDALEWDDTSAESVARALGLCKDGTNSNASQFASRWGLLDTRWRRLNDNDGGALEDARQVWLPTRFGTITPRQGSRMVVLSTGVARDVTDEGREGGYTSGCDTFKSERSGTAWSGGIKAPTGFPYDSSRCPDRHVSEGTLAYNEVGFELTVRTPTNVRALAFDSMFLTSEYPDWVCKQYNDFFVVLMDDAPREYEHDNILVDGAKNKDPIGVNSGLLRVCRRSDRAARDDITCEAGASMLVDTGYDREESSCAASQSSKEDVGGASTGWLHTEVKVDPGKNVTLHFLLWDGGDPLLDSTVLLDNFSFLTTEPKTIATTPLPFTH